EKVHRRHDRAIRRHLEDGGIVAARGVDEDPGIRRDRHVAQDLRQLGGPEFAGSARAVRVARQPDGGHGFGGHGSTEDTLSQSPGENGPGDDVTHDIGAGSRDAGPARERLEPRGQPRRDRRQRSDEREHQPPGAAAQRVEPQRREQREQSGFGDRPLPGPSRGGSPRSGLSGTLGKRSNEHRDPERRDHEPGRHGEPRQHQPPERHFLPRRSGDTYPGPRRPRPGRAAVSLPWSKTFCPFTNTYATPTDGWCGCSNVALSATVAGSNTVMSAARPDLSSP